MASKQNPTRKPTRKQVRFVHEYLKDLNGRQAAIRAGYPARTANEAACALLTISSIRELVDAAQHKAGIESELTVKWVVDNLKELAMQCLGKSPIRMMDQDVFKLDPANANKSLELLGRHLGAFLDKVEHSGIGPVQINIMPAGGAVGNGDSQRKGD